MTNLILERPQPFLSSPPLRIDVHMPEPRLKPKQWDPRFEEELIKSWQDEKRNAFNRTSGKPIYVIDTPPPYPSGSWHIGAVAGYSLIDMAARAQRMLGHEVLFPWGLDRNGINIELTVERKHGKSLHEFDREEFIDLCRQEIQKYCDQINVLAKRIGMSCDFENYTYETDSADYRRVTQAIFIDLFKRGLIYEGLRPSYFCTQCGTTIAEADIVYQERASKLTHIAFELVDGGELVIATTRPELIPACRAIIVHPDDERFHKIRHKKVIVPIFEREILVYPHPNAKPEFGSGAAMICSYGDQVDIQLFRELSLEPIDAIGSDGLMTKEAGPYKGLPVETAREKILGDLEALGLVRKQESVVHKTPLCERSKTPIEFIQMKDWYLKQLPAIEDLKRLAKEMQFFPDRHRQLLLDWIDSVTIDWPISRRRYYHTEIPLWYCDDCFAPLLPTPGKYYRPWKDPPPFDACPHCGGKNIRGEDRVFDTWMDSSNTNLVATLFMRDDEFFNRHFPTTLRPQGREIVRNWLYYTTLKSWYVMADKPFRHVFVHGLGLDEHGRAMHKSTGNVIDPEPVIEKEGSDAFRFWSASETMPGDDFRISEERIAGARKFLNKLWNVSRFVSSFDVPKAGKLQGTDRWILSELNELIRSSKDGYHEYNFFIPANRSREFLWNLFAPHYIEMVKGRAYEGDTGAKYTLHEVLKVLLRILAPVTPFCTDRIWRDVYSGSVHDERMPEAKEDWESELKRLTPELLEFNARIWKDKKDQNLSLKEPLEGVVIPESLKPFESDLVRMHNIK